MGALKNPKFVLPIMSHSAGTIVATFQNGSSLSRLISADVTLVANTLYMVYLVASGGTAALRISTNVNSVGPAGFTSWTLVGAFYSNGALSFGSMVTITGVPTSEEISYNPTLTSSGGGNITLNATGIIPPAGLWTRHGSHMKLYTAFRNGTGGAATGTAGGVKVGLPVNITALNSRTSDGNFGSYAGSVGAYPPAQGAGALAGAYFIYDFTSIAFPKPATGAAVSVSDLIAQYSINTDCKFAVSGWSNTQLVDL
jgi:hypothetical protein